MTETIINALPNWLLISLVIISIIMTVAVTVAILYRLVKYGVRIKAGPLELDATDETEGKK